jgi:hypothetical protein
VFVITIAISQYEAEDQSHFISQPVMNALSPLQAQPVNA